MAQPIGVIAVTVRDHHEVQSRQVDLEAFDVVTKAFRVVAGVEEDAHAVMLDQRGKAPVLLQRRRLAEGIGEDGDAGGGLGLDGRAEAGQQQEHEAGCGHGKCRQATSSSIPGPRVIDAAYSICRTRRARSSMDFDEA